LNQFRRRINCRGLEEFRGNDIFGVLICWFGTNECICMKARLSSAMDSRDLLDAGPGTRYYALHDVSFEI
jgi:hypothetical protein